MMFKILFATLVLTMVLPSFGQKYGISDAFDIPEGLKSGAQAPDFLGVDQNGQTVRLSDLLRKGPVVLLFYRGYWCPVCNRHLADFQESLALITAKGASVVAITPESNDGVSKTMNQTGVRFSVLSDHQYEIMDAYDVRFLVTDGYNRKIKAFKGIGIEKNNGDDQPYLPVPATYVIGRDGKIIKTFFDENYNKRPTAEEIAKYL